MADPATGTAVAGTAKVVAAPAWDAVKCSCTFCCTRGDYFSDLKDNLRSLGEQNHQLRELHQQVERQVAEEKKKSPRLRETRAITNWLDRVKEMIDDVTEVTKEGKEELQKKWLRWLFPKSCFAFNEVGRRVIRKVAEVQKLIEKGEKLDPLVERKPPSPVDEWQIGFKPLGLDSKVEEAWRYMTDPSAKIIGIHGSGGVGKTTLLKMINNKLRGTGHGFDVVIQANVSREGTVKKVQESILEKLEVPQDSWKDKSEDDRAKEIYEVLRTKKFVLLLDDLRLRSNPTHVSNDSSFIEKQEDLITVGIPLEGNGNESKVFFTTRSVMVCGRIGADKSIRVDCLSSNESLELFQSCVDEDTLNTPKVRGLANTLAAMCHGLPLVLVTVGRAMAHNKNPKQWNNAIEDTKRRRSNLPGVENDVFPVLKISYDCLSTDRIKECFLSFSVFWEVHYIKKQDLIELWIGEGFFGESCDINDACRDGEDIIESLKLASLSVIDESGEILSMHDVIHSMAIWLSSESRDESAVKKILVQEKTIDFQNWINVERILLWGSNIESLTGIKLFTERASFSQLKTLFVSSTKLEKFPDQFFLRTPALRVLNLSGNANLVELPVSIGGLKELHYLNLSRTRIADLRDEVKKLKKLEFLVLDEAFNISGSSREVISCLSSLQVLRIFVDWDYPYICFVNDEIGFLQMLECLENIKEISISLSSNKSVKKLLNSAELMKSIQQMLLVEDTRCANQYTLMQRAPENLERLLIWMPSFWKKFPYGPIHQEDLDGLVLPNDPGPSNPQLDHVQCLHFQNLVMVRIWSCPIENTNWLVYAPNLESLEILDCTDMVELIGQVEENLNLFSNLRELSLTHLPNLKRLCRQALLLDCLTKVTAKGCPSLHELPFDFSSAMNLREIKGEILWWESLDWKSDSIRQRLLPKFVPHYDMGLY